MTGDISPGAPTPPISFEGGAAAATRRLDARHVEVDDALLRALGDACDDVDVTDRAALAEAGRDWWPLAMHWALEGQVPGVPAAMVRPRSTEEVSGVLAACNAARVPVTAAGGRSGVCGASVPVHGGVVLDLTRFCGIDDVDDRSLVVDIRAGTFGDVLEHSLRTEHQLTLGHWPQSIALSTVGGWVACRSAGQLSTRYGKIEDMTVGLEVVLADGRVVHTGGFPRAAVGPDLTQLFVGSEGTLGVVTRARLRAHQMPPAERRGAWGFPSFAAGLEACRRILRRGATPAVLRLYDAAEADRSYGTGDRHVLLVLDEADPRLADAVLHVVGEECGAAERLDDDLVERWMLHRNDVSALEALTRRGYVVDTMEISGPWSALAELYDRVGAAIRAVEGAVVASAHQSHSYPDGGCLYFSFAGKPDQGDAERFYVEAWDAGTRAAMAAGGSLSHHHGVGLNRSRFMTEALGAGLAVVQSVKDALDPAGILNPGKLGLRDPFGEVGWP